MKKGIGLVKTVVATATIVGVASLVDKMMDKELTKRMELAKAMTPLDGEKVKVIKIVVDGRVYFKVVKDVILTKHQRGDELMSYMTNSTSTRFQDVVTGDSVIVNWNQAKVVSVDIVEILVSGLNKNFLEQMKKEEYVIHEGMFIKEKDRDKLLSEGQAG